LTLDAGSISVVDAGVFAGEGLMDTLKPGERRLLSYASDLGVLVSARSGEGSGRTRRIQIVDGVLVQKADLRDQRIYTIRNQDDEARSVVLEHPVRSEWKLAGTAMPVESTATVHRFQAAVAPGQTETLMVDELREGITQFALSSLTDQHLSVLADAGANQDALARALQPVFALQTEQDAITKDQARVRENMRTLGRSGTERRLLERYTAQLDAQETRLDLLKGQMASLQGRRHEADRRLSDLIRTLTLEIDF
jgi:hypothetical protein